MRLTDELLARGIRPIVDRHALRRGQGAPSQVTVDITEPMPGGDLLGVAMFSPTPAAVAITSSGRVWVLTGGETGKVVAEEGAPEETIEAVTAALAALIPQDAAASGADASRIDAEPLGAADSTDQPEAAAEPASAGKRRRKQAPVEDATIEEEEDAGAVVDPF